MEQWIFDTPWAGLIALPALYCLYRCKKVGVSRYFPHLTFFGRVGKWANLDWLYKAGAVILMALALMSPALIDLSDPRNRNGIDIVLSIDGSGSMNASGFDSDNVRSSRFEIVQKLAQDFVIRRDQDNVGVVLFGDFAFIASPVTYEKEMITEMIGYLTHGMAGNNTAIGEGIMQSVRALRDSQAKSKVIILLTDGEHNSGSISPKEAMTFVQQQNIRLYTIGIGKEGEFDSALLRHLAEEGDGKFFTAADASELKKVYESIDELERSSIKSAKNRHIEPYYQYAVAGALLILLYLGWKRRHP